MPVGGTDITGSSSNSRAMPRHPSAGRCDATPAKDVSRMPTSVSACATLIEVMRRAEHFLGSREDRR